MCSPCQLGGSDLENPHFPYKVKGVQRGSVSYPNSCKLLDSMVHLQGPHPLEDF